MNLPIRRPLARLPEPRQYPLTMLAVGAVRLPSPGEPENEGTGEPRERERLKKDRVKEWAICPSLQGREGRGGMGKLKGSVVAEPPTAGHHGNAPSSALNSVQSGLTSSY